ncbi:hypothetical protein CMV_022960 [Castanea mollissima]|uniref:Bulb-type lectin domain-containing protein n=1 Tax=Castanea mollissima TaxID=60419 RepID=A0A8J4QH01_9ROSI|nr:hypothetical protein CMV_022960 [Castanea mollissima]
MQLSETRNLVLVDAGNNTLWESFAHPTATIVMGQRIPIGKSLQSAVTVNEDMSVGDYRLEATNRDWVMEDAVLTVTIAWALWTNRNEVIHGKLRKTASISTHSISPDFTASFFQFSDIRGAFLRSQNDTFRATIDAKPPSSKYYFSVVHRDTDIIIWSANRDAPMSSSDKLSLTVSGLTVTNQAGEPLWSTPQFNSDISAMQLSETGNLVLVDAGNNTLWESFAHPTDTIVMGQRIPVGKSLQSAVTEEDMSAGDYRLEVTDGDVVLQWNKMNYWKLSSDRKAVRNSNKAVSLMAMNGTGLYLLASDNSTVVQVALNGSSSFRSGKLGPDGRFIIGRPRSRSDNKLELEVAGPLEDCDLPLSCKEIGLCRRKPISGSCSCLQEFIYQSNGDCMPVNRSLSLPSACTAARNGSQLNSSFSYLKLGPGKSGFLKPKL